MGNSNIQSPQTEQLQIFTYNQLYGRHQIKDNMAVKRFRIQEIEHQSFISLIENYKSIGGNGVMRICKWQHKYTDSSNNQIYEIYLPRYSLSLAQQIFLRKSPYEQHKIYRMISNISNAIRAFKAHQFPYGVLIPEKIAVDGEEYCVGLDLIMNQQFYRTGGKMETNPFYLSPQEINFKQTSKVYQVDQIGSFVYTLGLIAIKMTQGQDFERANLDKILYSLRKNYSYEFCRMLESMLMNSNWDRIRVQDLIFNHAQLCLKGDQSIVSQIYFKRGYNSIQSLSLLQQCQTAQSRSKWCQFQKINQPA